MPSCSGRKNWFHVLLLNWKRSFVHINCCTIILFQIQKNKNYNPKKLFFSKCYKYSGQARQLVLSIMYWIWRSKFQILPPPAFKYHIFSSSWNSVNLQIACFFQGMKVGIVSTSKDERQDLNQMTLSDAIWHVCQK